MATVLDGCHVINSNRLFPFVVLGPNTPDHNVRLLWHDIHTIDPPPVLEDDITWSERHQVVAGSRYRFQLNAKFARNGRIARRYWSHASGRDLRDRPLKRCGRPTGYAICNKKQIASLFCSAVYLTPALSRHLGMEPAGHQ